MKKFLFVSIALAVIKSANAQYTFQSITVAGSGPSAKATTILTWGPFQTLKECENARIRAESANTWSESILGGRIEAKTKAGPCSPPGGSSIGSPDVYGISKGTSFYSTNGSNEIQNWSEDEATRRMGLDKNYNSDESTNISTGDPDYDNARNGIDPNKLFVSVNMRDEQRNIVQPNEYYFGEVLGSNDKRWSDILEKESTNELYTDYTISENEKYDEIDFYADLAEDVLHSALDIAEVTGAVVGATTVAGTIAAAVLADLAVSLVIEDGVAVYKWVANDESVSTMDIFKNTLDRASFGATAFTKTGLEEALVKDGWLMNNNKLFFGKAVSIALRTVHYGNKLYDKVKENE